MAHSFVLGTTPGTQEGERAVHFTEDYRIDADAFPGLSSYVALGHIHRPQTSARRGTIYYSGTPMHLDFGHQHDRQINLVDITPGVEPSVVPVFLQQGRNVKTIKGTVEEIRENGKRRPIR